MCLCVCVVSVWCVCVCVCLCACLSLSLSLSPVCMCVSQSLAMWMNEYGAIKTCELLLALSFKLCQLCIREGNVPFTQNSRHVLVRSNL